MNDMLEVPLEDPVRDDLSVRVEEATRKGDFLPRERADAAIAEFRGRFGPDRLAGADGEALLLAMHGRGGEEECLAYWLEFKNDEIFPGRWFGGIGGGSAFKYGIYRRDTDGAWVTGTPMKPHVGQLSEAVDIARRQRDQLVRGTQILAAMPETGATDDVYLRLQQALDQDAPDLVNTIWAHKYWFLLFRDRLDDYHEPILQRYHLIRLLQAPPDGTGLRTQGSLGRYVCAGRFVGIARDLDIETYQLGFLLNQRHGRKRGYWRVGTASGEEAGREDHWPELLTEGRIGVGWYEVGDLSQFLTISSVPDLKRALREELVRTTYPNDETASSIEKAACTFGASVLLRVTRTIEAGDIVVACRGATVHGIGRVTGEYMHVPGGDFVHARPVEWLDNHEWQLPGGQNFRGQVVTDLAGYPEILIETERRTPAARASNRLQSGQDGFRRGAAGRARADRSCPAA